MSSLGSVRRAERVAVIATSATGIIGALTGTARVTGLPLFPEWPPGSSPVALWSSAVTLFLALGLLGMLLRPESRALRYGAAAIGATVVIAAVVTFIATVTDSPFDIERLPLIRDLARVPPVGPRSTTPLGPPTQLFAGAALLLLAVGRGRSLVGALALVPFLAGFIVAVASLYRVPLLHSPGFPTASLAAALSALLYSSALIGAAGPSVWPLNTLAGSSVRPLLFRSFMPLTVLVVVGTDLLTVNLFSGFSPALGSVINTILSVILVAVVTYSVAQTIAGRLRAAQRRAVEARFAAMLDERTRIARELHDTLLQGFTGLALQMAAVTNRMTGPPDVVAALRRVIGSAQATLETARRAIWDIRPPSAGGDLVAAIRAAAEQSLHGSGLSLEFTAEGSVRTTDPNVETAIYRVTQEAIANVVKHAAARTVRVLLVYEPARIRLVVTDDGAGFVVDPEFRAYSGHLGLLGMKERASHAHGTLTVTSSPGLGTEVLLVVGTPRVTPRQTGL